MTSEQERLRELSERTARAVADIPSPRGDVYDTVLRNAADQPVVAYGPRRVMEVTGECPHCEYHDGERLYWNGDANEGDGEWEHCDECDGTGEISLPSTEVPCAPEKAELWGVFRVNAGGLYTLVARAGDGCSARRCARTLHTLITLASTPPATTGVVPPVAGSTD